MAILNQKRILNLIPKVSAPVTLHVSQGDVGTQIEFTLVKGDELFIDTGDLTASVHGVRHDGANFGVFTCNLSGSTVSFPLHSEMSAIKGEALAEIVLVDSQGSKVGSANFGIMVEESVFPLGVTYDNDVSVYESILAYVQTIPAQVVEDYTSKINAEIAARQAADATINSSVDSLRSALANEVSARETADLSEATTRAAADANLQAQITQAISPSGTAPSVEEVTNARVGADGNTYTSLGNAIRTQVNPLFKSKMVLTYSDLSRNGFVNNNGVFTEHADYRTTPLIPCSSKSIIVLATWISSVAQNFYNLWAYNDQEAVIGAVLNVPSSTSPQELTASLPDGTEYITFTTAANANNVFYVIKSADTLPSQMLSIIQKEFNLLDYYTLSLTGIINTVGQYVDYPTLEYRSTDFIPVSGNIYVRGKFSVVQEGYYNINGYDENKQFIAGISHFTTSGMQNIQIALDSRVKYIRVMTTTSYNTNIFIYSYPDVIGHIYNKLFELKNIQLLYDEKYDYKTFTTCDNLTNLVNVGDGYGIGVTNKVEKGSILKTITFIDTPMTANNDKSFFVFVACDGRVIKKFPITAKVKMTLNYVVEESGYLCYCRVSGSGAILTLYYKANVQNDTDDGKTKVNSYIFTCSNMINEGSKLNPPRVHNSSKNFISCIVEGYAIDADESYSPKYAAFLGDSITAGYSWNSDEQQAFFVDRPFPRTVQKILDFDIQLKGYSSYPISSTGKDDCLLAVYNTIDTDVDYIIVFAGTNDLFYNVPIGTVDDRTDVSFCGAVYALISGLLTNYPNAQIVFMTPIHRQWEGQNQENANLIDYVNAMKEVCGLCGIPVIDLYNESYFNYIVDVTKALYSDGLHPTQEGYDLLGKVVAKRINNLFMI